MELEAEANKLTVDTGPMLCAGNELAEAASQSLEMELKFEDVSEREARNLLKSQSDLDPSELQYLLEYYSLVRQGKTNYISTTAFHDITGQHPTEPVEFFKEHKEQLVPQEQPSKKRKTANGS
ncbi:hypothetical protein HRR78_000826 [Exophiala dermatitidis]|nr:hypothetical protein HRR75_001731 [Exophiala dermatitidis]KAJ4560299.1 hypothetical protein HRR78_000826 [Exophiala dermatitidis]